MLVRALLGAAALLAAAGCASSSEVAAVASAAPSGDEARICKEILLPGSNVLQTVCDTEENWRDYERARRRDSQQLMRRMQGLSGG